MRAYIDARVSAGNYGNTSEYIRDLVRKDQEEQARQRLRDLIEEGLASGLGARARRRMTRNCSPSLAARSIETRHSSPAGAARPAEARCATTGAKRAAKSPCSWSPRPIGAGPDRTRTRHRFAAVGKILAIPGLGPGGCPSFRCSGAISSAMTISMSSGCSANARISPPSLAMKFDVGHSIAVENRRSSPRERHGGQPHTTPSWRGLRACSTVCASEHLEAKHDHDRDGPPR